MVRTDTTLAEKRTTSGTVEASPDLPSSVTPSDLVDSGAAGRVTVITNLAAPTRHQFMDISSRVTTGGEEGLLGIAFHPNYRDNRYFYLFYSLTTTTAAGSGRHQRVSRFEISPTDPNLGVSGSEVPLITQRDDYSNHNGGDLHFGSDGYLYITLQLPGQSLSQSTPGMVARLIPVAQ